MSYTVGKLKKCVDYLAHLCGNRKDLVQIKIKEKRISKLPKACLCLPFPIFKALISAEVCMLVIQIKPSIVKGEVSALYGTRDKLSCVYK